MDNDEGICPICKEYKSDIHHNSTLNHRFCFRKLEYNENRKNLISDRHGVKLEVEIDLINNHTAEFGYKRGKYVTKVTPEQLQSHNNNLTYNCVITNTRQDDIYITVAELLHCSSYFDIHLSVDFGEDQNSFINLRPGGEFRFSIVFETDILTYASYKIPLICSFQTQKGKIFGFTIVRTFLIYVDDATERRVEKTKSPFTSQQWKDIQITHPPTKDTIYTDKYPIPHNYYRLLAHCFKPFDNMSPLQQQYLRELTQLIQSLTKENYNKFWHIILWLEEMGQSLMLMKYNMQEVTMEIKNGKYLVLEVPGLAEKRPSVIVGDFIKIRLTGDHTAYKGFVCSVNDKTIEISHVNHELIEYLQEDPDIALDVSFTLGRLSFERMHDAVDKLVMTGMVRNLFPITPILSRSHTTHQLDDSQIINKSVCRNPEQRNAVVKILNSVNSSPYIVYGPPGTGKTITIVEAILQIKKRTTNKIIVCAPANAACDMLAMKLKDHCKVEELIRIHSLTRDRTTIPEELKEYSNMDDGDITKVSSDKLSTYRIVVTTLVLIGKYCGSYRPDCVFVDEAAQASEPETDIAIALVTTGKLVVLAGDHKQLGPMTTKAAQKYGLGRFTLASGSRKKIMCMHHGSKVFLSNSSADSQFPGSFDKAPLYRFGISLLERLMNCDVYQPNPRTRNYDSNFITMLKLNFRSHPAILSIPNELFYGNLLQAMSIEAQRDPIANIAVYPVIKKSKAQSKGYATEFCSVSAKEKREGTSPSFFNLPESKMVVKYVQALHNLNVAEAYKVRQDQIGVVTPYKRQVFKIKEGLRYNGFQDVEVGTTETFQGREKRIIIISTVRAQHSLLLHDRKYNLGFVKHDQRFNVALTRAISKLIIIGNPLVLRTDSKWLKYMDMCEEHDTYFGNQFAKDDVDFRTDVLRRMTRFKPQDDQYQPQL